MITDCNMPRMSGFELARAIRAREAQMGLPRTPILGCTANALADAALDCRNAGMDDSVTKPVALEDLCAQLDRWLALPSMQGMQDTQPGVGGALPLVQMPPPRTDGLVDLALLETVAGGNPAALAQVIADFRRANEDDAAELRRAARRDDFAEVVHYAHRVRGASAMLGATMLADASASVQEAAATHRAGDVHAAMQEFEMELLRLNNYGHPALTPAEATKRPIRLVLADDHDVVRAGIKALLSRIEGVEVVGEAADGQRLVELTAALGPDIVLTDIQMPVMDGLAAVSWIHEHHPAIRLVVLSMHEEVSLVRDAMARGACGYLMKNAPGIEVEHAVRSVMDRGNYFSPTIAQRLLRGPSATEPADLTERQRDILRMLAQGLAAKEIAFQLGLSTKTVDMHRSRLMARLKINDWPAWCATPCARAWSRPERQGPRQRMTVAARAASQPGTARARNGSDTNGPCAISQPEARSRAHSSLLASPAPTVRTAAARIVHRARQPVAHRAVAQRPRERAASHPQFRERGIRQRLQRGHPHVLHRDRDLEAPHAQARDVLQRDAAKAAGDGARHLQDHPVGTDLLLHRQQLDAVDQPGSAGHSAGSSTEMGNSSPRWCHLRLRAIAFSSISIARSPPRPRAAMQGMKCEADRQPSEGWFHDGLTSMLATAPVAGARSARTAAGTRRRRTHRRSRGG
ncbi:response regulator [Ramlibacter terrae]|uniref:Response regulator n=1 Tax=Ramlibacter terrae TaxID=2732511 RepID=A0ABX6P7H8_9BURK|nr:response regulator [Ramlibacter terrae]